MGTPVKIGLLGGGGILGAHAPGLVRLADECEVAVVAETDPSRHGRIRELLRSAVPIVSDYREALDFPGLDAVDILLPHSMHLEATLAAARRGLHVLCEKVMARNLHEARQMVEACQAASRQLVIVHDRRYADGWRQLKEVVESGRLGEIHFAKMEHNQDVTCPPGSWIFSREGIGGGAIMSCLTHQIDALRWMLGEVASVQCMSRVVPSRMEGECIGVVSAKMASGALASLSINWHTRSVGGEHGLWYEFSHICGALGEAYHMSGRGTFVKDGQTGGVFAQCPPDPSLTGHQRCIQEFVRSVSGRPARVLTPGADSQKTVEVAEAAYLSEARERAVRLPIAPVPWNEREYGCG